MATIVNSTTSATVAILHHFLIALDQLINFIFIMGVIFTILGILILCCLGGGALALSRYMLGYSDEIPKTKKGELDGSDRAFFAGLLATGVLLVGVWTYLFIVDPQPAKSYTNGDLFGISVLSVMSVWGFILIAVGIWSVIVQISGALSSRKGGRECVNQVDKMETVEESV